MRRGARRDDPIRDGYLDCRSSSLIVARRPSRRRARLVTPRTPPRRTRKTPGRSRARPSARRRTPCTRASRRAPPRPPSFLTSNAVILSRFPNASGPCVATSGVGDRRSNVVTCRASSRTWKDDGREGLHRTATTREPSFVAPGPHRAAGSDAPTRNSAAPPSAYPTRNASGKQGLKSIDVAAAPADGIPAEPPASAASARRYARGTEAVPYRAPRSTAPVSAATKKCDRDAALPAPSGAARASWLSPHPRAPSRPRSAVLHVQRRGDEPSLEPNRRPGSGYRRVAASRSKPPTRGTSPRAPAVEREHVETSGSRGAGARGVVSATLGVSRRSGFRRLRRGSPRRRLGDDGERDDGARDVAPRAANDEPSVVYDGRRASAREGFPGRGARRPARRCRMPPLPPPNSDPPPRASARASRWSSSRSHAHSAPSSVPQTTDRLGYARAPRDARGVPSRVIARVTAGTGAARSQTRICPARRGLASRPRAGRTRRGATSRPSPRRRSQTPPPSRRARR